MNSEQFCKTEEWIEFRDALWKKFYHMEASLYFIEDKKEWVEMGCPRGPHPMDSGHYIKCSYCGWYGQPDGKNFLLFDHILPVYKYPHLRLNESNLTICCAECNKKKGGLVGDPTRLTDIMLQYQEDAESNLKLDFMNPSKFYRKMKKIDGLYHEYFVPFKGLKTHQLYVGA